MTLPDSVTSIGEEVFRASKSLTTVILSKNLTTIPRYSFSECDLLENIDLSYVTKIEEYAFFSCEALKTITIYKDTIIGEKAFNFSGLTEVTVYDGVTVGVSAFENCTSLIKVTFKGKATFEVGDGHNQSRAFALCTSLTTVDFGGVENISAYAFVDCTSLEKIDLSNVKTIEDGAFTVSDKTSSLKTVIFGENLDKIGDYAFSECKLIEALSFPDSLHVIGYHAFYECSALKTLTFPIALQKIEANAFAKCYALETLTFPASLISIGNNAFDCVGENLTSITLNSTTDDLQAILGNFYLACFNNMANTASITFTNVTVAEVTEATKNQSAGGTAWYMALISGDNCENFSINCKDGELVVYHVAKSAGDCQHPGNTPYLEDLTADNYQSWDGTQWIYAYKHVVFIEGTHEYDTETHLCRLCDSIDPDYLVGYEELLYEYDETTQTYTVTGSSDVTRTEIQIPYYYTDGQNGYHKVATIADKAFQYSSLTIIYLPESIVTIGASAFDNTNLASVTIPDSVTTIGYNAFQGCNNLESVTLSSNLTEISSGVFGNCTSLKTINLSNVTSIGQNAFVSCDNLRSVDLSKAKTLSGYAFLGCGLEEVVIADGASLYSQAFSQCLSLTKVTFSGTATLVGNSVFEGCTLLQTVDLGKIENIPARTFYGCVSLVEVDLSNVKTIGDSAFDMSGNDDVNLKKVTFGENLTAIGKDAFHGCKVIEALTIPASVQAIGNDAFKDVGERLTELTVNTDSDGLQKVINALYNSGLISMANTASITFTNVTVAEVTEATKNQEGDPAWYTALISKDNYENFSINCKDGELVVYHEAKSASDCQHPGSKAYYVDLKKDEYYQVADEVDYNFGIPYGSYDEIVIAGKHSYSVTYTYDENVNLCTANGVCTVEGCAEDAEGHTVTATTYEINPEKKDSTCTTVEIIVYKARFDDVDWIPDTDDNGLVIVKEEVGTTYKHEADSNDATYTYVKGDDGNYYLIATATCRNGDCQKVLTAKALVTDENIAYTNSATCQEVEKTNFQNLDYDFGDNERWLETWANDVETSSRLEHKLGSAFTADNWTDERPATCTEDGERGHYTCSHCKGCFDADGNRLERGTYYDEKDNPNGMSLKGSHSYILDESRGENGFYFDGNYFTAYVVCENCTEGTDNHTREYLSIGEYEETSRTEPTEDKDGSVTYKVTFDENANWDGIPDDRIVYVTIALPRTSASESTSES